MYKYIYLYLSIILLNLYLFRNAQNDFKKIASTLMTLHLKFVKYVVINKKKIKFTFAFRKKNYVGRFQTLSSLIEYKLGSNS